MAKFRAPWAREQEYNGTYHDADGRVRRSGIAPEVETIVRGTAAPTTGAHAKGEIVFNSNPAAAGKIGWTCVTAGTPGTWKAFGAIDS